MTLKHAPPFADRKNVRRINYASFRRCLHRDRQRYRLFPPSDGEFRRKRDRGCSEATTPHAGTNQPFGPESLRTLPSAVAASYRAAKPSTRADRRNVNSHRSTTAADGRVNSGLLADGSAIYSIRQLADGARCSAAGAAIQGSKRHPIGGDHARYTGRR